MIAVVAAGGHGVSVQQELNVFGADEPALAACDRHELAVLARTPLAMGLLSGKYRLRCLRDTGMRMADLRRFVAIDGDRDPARRRALLEAHRAAVLERIERTHRELEVLDGKIAAYREMEERAAQPV